VLLSLHLQVPKTACRAAAETFTLGTVEPSEKTWKISKAHKAVLWPSGFLEPGPSPWQLFRAWPIPWLGTGSWERSLLNITGPCTLEQREPNMDPASLDCCYSEIRAAGVFSALNIAKTSIFFSSVLFFIGSGVKEVDASCGYKDGFRQIFSGFKQYHQTNHLQHQPFFLLNTDLTNFPAVLHINILLSSYEKRFP
jgi:hypothetical protein